MTLLQIPCPAQASRLSVQPQSLEFVYLNDRLVLSGEGESHESL